MIYKIHITKKASEDLDETLDYIEFALKNKACVDFLLESIVKELQNLSHFPFSHTLFGYAISQDLEIRYFTIEKYLIFYAVSNETITILRILHEKRNWLKIINQLKL